MIKRRFLTGVVAATLILTSFGLPARADGPNPTADQTQAADVTTLAADQTDLSLTVAPGSQTQASIQITAPASAAVTISTDATWLSLTPKSFKGSATVTVKADGTGMTPGDVQIATIDVSAGPAGTLSIPVSLTVQSENNAPMMAALPTRLDLGTLAEGKVTVKTVTLQFATPLSGTISGDSGWLDVQPRTFTNTTHQTVIVKITTNNLIKGQTYTGNLEARSGSYPTLTVPVIFKVDNPPPPKRSFKSPFRDVPDDHWAIEAIVSLSEQKVITGIGDGKYAPDLMVTREQFARMLVGALHLPLKSAPATPSFSDVPTNRWSAAYIETVKPFLIGYKDGLFRPEAVATREDMAAALALAKGFGQEPPADPSELDAIFSDAQKISADLKPLVAIAVQKNLIKGFDDGTFRPQEPLTRAQAASLLYRAEQVGGNDKGAPVQSAPGQSTSTQQ